MKICLISTGYPPEDGGGIGTYIFNLALGLKKSGHQVFVLTQTRLEDRHEVRDGIEVFRFKSRYVPKLEKFFPGWRWSQFIAQKILELDQRIGFDLIEFPNWEGVGYCYLKQKKRKPVVVRVHTPYFETLELDAKNGTVGLGDRFICWLEKRSCQESDQLVSSTICHRDFIAKNYQLKKEEIAIVPLGIQLIEKSLVHYSCDHQKLKVLYVSRLENRKGTITLIDAIDKVLVLREQVEFIFIGKDRPHAPDGMQYQEYFQKNYFVHQGSVQFLGFVSNEELFTHYQKADIFAVPSLYESFGLIYVEAMMHGKPVIGCRSGGISEVIDDRKTGILIEPGNVEQLVKALIDLIDQKALREELGRNARKHCEQHFSAEIMARNTERLYRQTIEKWHANTN